SSFDPIEFYLKVATFLAAPKKKTSHSKKRMRSANKGLKDKTNI
ncbi:7369_t:CDS:1, partial [Dentiscutata heterogama]